jgi:hypothetical protein
MCCIQGGKTALSAVFFVGVRKSVNVSKKKAFPKAYDGPRSPAAQDVWRLAFRVRGLAVGVPGARGAVLGFGAGFRNCVRLKSSCTISCRGIWIE